MLVKMSESANKNEENEKEIFDCIKEQVESNKLENRTDYTDNDITGWVSKQRVTKDNVKKIKEQCWNQYQKYVREKRLEKYSNYSNNNEKLDYLISDVYAEQDEKDRKEKLEVLLKNTDFLSAQIAELDNTSGKHIDFLKRFKSNEAELAPEIIESLNTVIYNGKITDISNSIGDIVLKNPKVLEIQLAGILPSLKAGNKVEFLKRFKSNEAELAPEIIESLNTVIYNGKITDISNSIGDIVLKNPKVLEIQLAGILPSLKDTNPQSTKYILKRLYHAKQIAILQTEKINALNTSILNNGSDKLNNVVIGKEDLDDKDGKTTDITIEFAASDKQRTFLKMLGPENINELKKSKSLKKSINEIMNSKSLTNEVPKEHIKTIVSNKSFSKRISTSFIQYFKNYNAIQDKFEGELERIDKPKHREKIANLIVPESNSERIKLNKALYKVFVFNISPVKSGLLSYLKKFESKDIVQKKKDAITKTIFGKYVDQLEHVRKTHNADDNQLKTIIDDINELTRNFKDSNRQYIVLKRRTDLKVIFDNVNLNDVQNNGNNELVDLFKIHEEIKTNDI